LNSEGGEIHWDFIRALMASVAATVLIPLQDVLGLGSEARMNMPSTSGSNWKWRCRPEMLRAREQQRLATLARTYERC
jgi:4-alpha-glucanotransferase